MAFLPVLDKQLLPMIDYGVEFVTAIQHGSRIYAASRTGIYRLSEDVQSAELVFSFGTTFTYACALNSTGQVLFLTGGSSSTTTSVYRSFDGTTWELWKAHTATNRWYISGAGNGGYILIEHTGAGRVGTLGAVDGSEVIANFDPANINYWGANTFYHPQPLVINPLSNNKLWVSRFALASINADNSISSLDSVMGALGITISIPIGDEGVFVAGFKQGDFVGWSELQVTTDGTSWSPYGTESLAGTSGATTFGSAIYTKFGILHTISETSIANARDRYTFLVSPGVTVLASGQAGYANPADQVCSQFLFPLSDTEFLFLGRLNHNTSPTSGQILRLYGEPPETPEFWTAFVKTYEVR